jgi:biotin carboxylase
MKNINSPNQRTWFVLLGGNKLHQGIFDKCKKKGKKVVVIDWNKNPEIKGDMHLRCDIKNIKKVLDALSKAKITSIWLAYTSIDQAVPSVAAIHKSIGLSAPEGNISRKPLSKKEMVDCWQRDRLLQRESIMGNITKINQLVKQCKSKYVIIKPNLASSSRGITVVPACSTISNLKKAFFRAKKASFDKKVIVEEFVEGQEFTVEMLGDKNGNVDIYGISVKYHSKNAGTNKIATKLHYNSKKISNHTYQKIADYARECYKSAGLNTSFGHLEIIMKSDGTLSPVEIGARSTGFVCSPLIEVVSRRDYLQDYRKVLKGALLKISGGNQKCQECIFSMISRLALHAKKKHGSAVFCQKK